MVHSIKMHYDRKIQDMGAENVYIYVSYDSNHTKSDVFSAKISMVTNVIIDFIQRFNKQVNIKRLTF